MERFLSGRISARPLSIGLGFGAVFLFAALFSHSPRDGSFWNATSYLTSNWLGAFGANLSCALFYAVGNAAWVLPIALAVWSWRVWFGQYAAHVTAPARIGVPVILALLAGAAFCSAIPGKMVFGTGFGGWLGDRLILPFARMFDSMGFDAPYQIPGLVMAVIALIGLGGACGLTRTEARSIGRQSAHKLRGTVSRERRRVLTDSVMSRTSDLTRKMRTRGIVPETPMSLRGGAEGGGQGGGLREKLQNVGKKKPISAHPVTAPGARPASPSRKRQKTSQRMMPDIDLLNPPKRPARPMSDGELRAESDLLLKVLNDYGVQGEMMAAKQGPVVTLHELDPAAGTKAARVVGLSDDIARSMSALSARVAPVKGRSVIGIELPNDQRETVYLKEIMEPLMKSSDPLPLALGKGINGEVQIASLAKMPHLLVAGTTGAGKSVAINAMILSLLYRHPPSECRMIMIDPKMLELSVYDGIPHLLSPVVTDPKKAVMALKWVVKEMEGRYRKMAEMNVRNLDGYNARMAEALAANEMLQRNITDEFGEARIEEYQPEKLPYIVVVVDEMADLMMVAGKEIEACIQRLAQMARASGIHIIMATQRPSVDVITGTIKANFPTRISFQVTSKIDSRTILGEQGAEQLLGQGDMLYMAGGGRITRIHGPFVSDEEVQLVANDLREKAGEPPEQVQFEALEGGRSDVDEILGLAPAGSGGSEERLYDQAVAIVASDRKASISYIQRRLQIGYNKAARLMEQMEEQGVVTPANNAGKRDILIEER